MLRLLLLISFLVAPSVRAESFAVDCACAGRDPLASKDKANCLKYDPVKADKTCFEDDSCVYPAAVPTPQWYDLFNVFLKSPPSSGIKSFAETLDYVSCHRARHKGFSTADRQFCHFKKTLAPYIKLAAESAGLSPSVMTCLVKAESEFSALANSGLAQGYPQLTPATRATMNNIIRTPKESLEAKIAERKTKIAELEAELAKKESPQKRALLREKTTALRSLVAMQKVREVWEQYWEGSNPVPKSINLASVQCPRIAFAVSAAKKVYDLHAMFDEEDIKKTANGRYYISTLKSERNELDTAIYLSGAYNAGAANFTRKCDPAKGIQRCLNISHPPKSLPRETAKHMNAVANCAEAGSTKPMRWDWQKKKVPADKDCEAYKCSK